MKITLIGSGNVAHVLGRLFWERGHKLLQVISPDKEHARNLAENYDVPWSDDLNSISPDAEMIILAVKDGALGGLNKVLRLKDQLVVHTAGGVPLEAIRNISSRTGVLYPLQTLHRDFDAFRDIPFLLEADSASGREKLMELAKSISGKIVWMSSEERLKMHVAGVFCNNFTNHLVALCENFCRSELLDFSLLFPLLEETFVRIKTAKAAEIQTGPARRGDLSTMKLHEQVLENYPEMLRLYEIFSEGIRKYYSDSK